MISLITNLAARRSLLIAVHPDRYGKKVTVHVLKDTKRLVSCAFRNVLDTSFTMQTTTASVMMDKLCLIKSQDA